jgi:hypothetical protein
MKVKTGSASYATYALAVSLLYHCSRALNLLAWEETQMKRSKFGAMLSVVLLALLFGPDSYGQSGAPGPQRANPDQLIQELLSEVHQLRVAMQQISVNAYRGQIMVERLRLQQDQVSRLTRDLNDIRSGIADIRAYESIEKERLEDAEKQLEKGVLSEIKVNELRANTTDMKRRQQNLSEREAQVALELEQERSNLADLNKRLDALEREIQMTGLVNEGKKNPR